MGKWIERLQSKTAHTPTGGTDETDETLSTGVLSVLAVGAERGCANSSPADPGPDLSAVAWTDEDIARFLARRARLLRWGWPESEAEALADRLVRRDRDLDARVSCADCKHYRPGRCGNHRRAGLSTPDVGRDLAGMLQRCPGFDTRETMT